MKRIFTLFIPLFFISWISYAQPSSQASAIKIEPVPGSLTSLKFTWTNGNGAGRIAILRDVMPGNYVPVNGVTTPAANTNFTAGTNLDGVGTAKCVLNGTASTVTVTNLAANTFYYLQVYEWSGTTGNPTYSYVINAANPISLKYYAASGGLGYIVPDNATAVNVQAWGAGGGGGGADSNGTDNRAGGGGGGGGYSASSSVSVTPNATVTVTVGAGGGGGVGGDPAGFDTTPADGIPDGVGEAGEQSTFGALVTAGGGNGGFAGVSADRTGNGGAGGTGATFNGGNGSEAPPTSQTTSNATASGGGGGSAGTTGAGGSATNATAGAAGANGGGIGAVGRTGLAANTSGVGNNAAQLGGGGSGGWDNRDDNNVAPGAKGGDGANGFVIVSHGDVTAPTVTSVSSSTADGTYIISQTVAITVAFSEIVIVTGTPQITLETGTVDRVVNYSSGSGTNTLTFNYTVQSGDVSADLDYVATTSLALNGGTIKDIFSNNATLTLATPGAAGSIGNAKAIVIDGVQPTVSTVSSSKTNAKYTVGEVIDITVEFSAAVTVTGGPQITLETGTTDRVVNYTSGSTTTTLTFNYTVQAGDESADLDYVSTSALAFNGGTIKNAAGNNAILTLATPGAAGSLGANKAIIIDTKAPIVSTVSSTKSDGQYKVGEVIGVTITFDEDVIVTGTPQLTLETGATDRIVDFTSVSGAVLTFDYTVQAGDQSLDLDYLNTTALALNSGTIKDGAGNNATLTLAAPGAAGSLGASKAIIIDTSSPTVSTVTSTKTNGSYNAGVTIDITVQFNENVTVTGTPQIKLETGATDQVVDYSSGGGTNTLTFTYTVQTGDESPDLDYFDAAALTLNSGTIKDGAGNDATLTLVTPGAAGSLGANKAIVIDTTVPTVSGVSSSTTDGTYIIGQVVAITVTFTEPVTVTGTPQITLETGTTDRTVNYSGGTGTATLTFNYTVQSGDNSSDLDYISTSALALNSGTIKDAAGNNATLTLATPGAAGSIAAAKDIAIDGIQPTVTNVTSTKTNGTYTIGENIDITVQFSAAVTVTGNPQITLETGTTDHAINYGTGSTTNTLTFTYTVQAGDATSDLDYLSTSALAFNGGTIKSASGNNAILTLASPGAAGSLGANKAIVIDTQPPVVNSVSSSLGNGQYKAGQVVPITITFSKVVTVTGTPQLTLETGSTDQIVDYSSGSGSATLTFNYTVQAGDVSSDLDYISTSALALNSGTIKDAIGNNATLTLASPGTAGSLGANKAIIIDTSAPNAPAAFSSVTTEGTVVANYWNGTNTGGTNLGVNLSVAIPGDPSLLNGTVEVEARVSTGSFATITTVSALSITAISGTKIITIDDGPITGITGYAQGALIQFRVRYTDVAGNVGAYTQTSNSLLIDTVAPTITGTPSFSANGGAGNRETIVINFSETLNLSNGALPVIGTPGFSPNQATIRNNATNTFYTSAGNTITLSSNNDNDWSATIQITYTKSNNAAGNYVRDVAGNELGTVIKTVNAPAPVLASSMVLDPNFSGQEKITFTVDQTLNTSTTANAVTGITVDGVSFNGTYTTVGNVITLLSGGVGVWDASALVSYSAGNLAGSSGTPMAGFVSEPILLGYVVISSNNANTAYAKQNDQISVGFVTNSVLSATPTATIGGLPAVVTGTHPSYTATVTADATVPAGPIAFSIVALQTNRSTTVTKTIPGSSVIYDRTAPTVVLSDNQSDNSVRDADNVTFTATFTEANAIDEGTVPRITIGSVITNVNMVKTSNLVWTYTWNVPAGNDGTANVSISATDVAGNANAAVTGTRTSFIIDNTQPTVVLSDSEADNIVRDVDNVTITATFTEANQINETIAPTITIGSVVSAVTMTKTSNLVWTYTWNVPSGSSGTHNVTITSTDIAGNTNTAATGRTSWIIDNVSPTVVLSHNQTDNVVRDADNVIITATFTEANQIYETTAPRITIGSLVTNVTMTRTDNLHWTYTWNVPSGNDGTVAVSISATDVAGNANAAATGVTSYTIDNTAPTITPISIVSNNATNTSYAKTGNTITLSFTVSETPGATPTVTINGTTVTASNIGLVYTAIITTTSSFPETVIPFSISLSDIAGNSQSATATTNSSSVTFDKTLPTVTNISLPSANPNATGSVQFTVTYSEAVTNVGNNDFITNGSASGGTETKSVSGSGTTYTVTVSNISKEGLLGLTAVDNNNSIIDVAGNLLSGDVASSSQYTVRVPEPANDPGSFIVTGTTNKTIQLSWTDVTSYPVPHGYLITIERPGGPAAITPSDGTPVLNQLDLIGNFTGYYNALPGEELVTLTLLSGQNYTFKIYPYTNSGSNINFRTPGSPATATGSTTVGSTGLLVSSGSGALIQDFSSLTTSFLPVTHLFEGSKSNLWVQITDDGNSTAATDDNAKTIMPQVIITAGSLNTVGHWNDIIAEAKLRAFTSPTFDVPLLEKDSVTTTTIGANSITFNLNTGDDQIGEIDDDEVKYYQLYIRFKSPLDNTNGMRALIDNKAFDFQFEAPASFPSYGSGSSKIETGEVASSGGGNVVRVSATELRFVQQPSNTLLGVAMSPAVSVEATDIYGTRDLNAAGSVSISSSGTVSGTPSATLTSGIGTVSSLVHIARGTGLQLTATQGSLTTNPVSSAFDITASNQADIVLDNTFTETSDILYKNYQATDITGGTNDIAIARFNIRDAGGSPTDPDNSGTKLKDITFNISNVSALRKVALYDGITEIAELPATSPLTFNNINGGLGYGPNDNLTRTFTVRVSFKNSAPEVIDNTRIQFTITTATTTNQSSDFAATDASGATTSTTGTENLIEVVASKFFFTTAPTSSVFANVPFSPAPLVLEARDLFDVIDVDYAKSVDITNADNLPMTDASNTSVTTISLPFVAGVLTFKSDFRYDIKGDGTLTIIDPSPGISLISNTITVNVSSASDIVEGTFAYPDNIAYIDYQANDIDITSSGDEIEVAQFKIQDGGAAANDPDKTATELNSISFTVSNYAFIKKLALYNGSTELSEVAVTGPIVTFNSLSVSAGDDLSTVLSLYATFNTANIVDHGQINFTVSTATANPNKSTFAASDAGGATTTLVNPDDNKIKVTATQLDITSPALPTDASLNSNFPGVVVQARDANANLDLDFNGKITELTNVTNRTMANGPTIGSSAFASGVYNFPNTFQFTSGANGDNVTLTIKADNIGGTTGTSCGSNAICSGISPTITLQTSFESSLVLNPAFSIPSTILYLPYQEAANIQNTGTSHELYSALLIDGSRGPGFTYSGFPLNTNTNSGDGLPNTDSDGAGTSLTSIKFRITKPSAIRRIALYADGVEIPNTEINVTAIGGITAATPSYDFTWTGGTSGIPVNMMTAGDDSEAILSVRVSFRNTSPEINDHDDIRVELLDATLGTGSQFFLGVGYIAGHSPVSSASFGKIDVVATRLDFTTQPAVATTIAGINEPISPPVVEARDVNQIVDLDYDSSNPNVNYRTATLTSAVGLSMSTFPFTAGKLNFPLVAVNGPLAGSLYYTSTGNGKLTVTANGLSSNTGGSTPSINVDVMHVSAVATSSSSGVLTSNNIKGGTAGAVLFGVTFTPQGQTSSEPFLNGFSFLFDHPYKTSSTTILKNFKVFESTSGNFSSSSDVVISYSATVTSASSPTAGTDFDMVTVTFPTPRTLYQGINRSYFLVADVDVTANISTQNLTPQLIDLGYGNNTNTNIITSKGSSAASVIGQTYKFASTRPPQLISSVPFNGQLNVDPNLQYIDLIFDVSVLTYDASAQLYDRQNNKLVANLTAANGIYDPLQTLSSVTTNPLRFNINLLPGKSLKRDSVYYVTIAKGSFNTGSQEGTGISDDGLNFYGGISYNGTLYFKISSPNAPKLVGTNSGDYFVSPTAATFNTTFDIPGKAYYLVTNPGVYNNATISNTIIKNGTGGITNGSYLIEQLSPRVQSTTFTADLPGTNYDVWIYAENDAMPLPLKVETTNAFGGFIAPNDLNNYKVIGSGGVGPTLELTVNPASINKLPDYQVCSNSTTLLTEPIILGEPALNSFSGGVQDFNVLLPTNFLFDVNNLPTITVSGSDFHIVPGETTKVVATFINSSVLNIKVNNSGNSDSDNIIISNMRIIATGAAAGKIKRFSGTGLPTITTDLANISSSVPQTASFTNTYNDSNNFISFGITDVVNYIPDNFNTPISTVRLIPPVTPNDYGSSFFSGPGVTNDILSLNGVTLNAAFDITMTHTDMNGCVTQKTEQFTVYDHTKAIPVLGTQQCIINNSFPDDYSGVYPSPTLKFTDIAGYSLIQLYANIPKKVGTDNIDQIIKGSAWQTIIENLPAQGLTPHPGPSGLTFYDYTWNYSKILNAASFSSTDNIETKPYDNFQGGFEGQGTPNGKHYWNGGSLGVIEFTGKFQSNADYSLFVPFRQEVEIFVPAIPVIEVSEPSQTASDGTAIYCEAGGTITINGYPAASAGSSTGTFKIINTVTNAVINASSPAFVDNGNGTATISPLLLNNSYQPIKIIYTYKDNKSPCESTATFNIQITPTPKAGFTMKSTVGPNILTTDSYCERKPILFTSTSTIALGSGGFIEKYSWDFGDPNASADNKNTDTTTNVPYHSYIQTAIYNPTLIATSSYGCESAVAKDTVNVGIVPVVKFNFTGVSTADKISFENKTNIPAGSVNDDLVHLDWDFGDQTVLPVTSNFNNVVTNKYDAAKPYIVTLKVTSRLGCVDSLRQSIVVLPQSTPTDADAYNETFEGNNGGDWQVWNTGNSTNGMSKTPISWAYGTPSTAVIKIDPTINGSSVWKTNLSGNYNGYERSALYSPSFDLNKLERPMISFSSFVQMESSDGVVLQYSVDSKNITDVTKEWFALGDIGDGVDWFTSQGIAAKPGDQTLKDLAWSNANITNWLTSKHSLAAVQDAKQVVFRFALGSTKEVVGFEGFAVDNVRIGERTRTVLFESFANTSNTNPQEKIQNTAISDTKTVGTEVVKVNYHVGFPGRDPFNDINTADPSARALYYNVKSTPATRIDGTKDEQDRLFNEWGSSSFEVRSLQLSQANLDIKQEVKADGTISVRVDVNAVVDLPENTILHVVVLEESIAASVVKSDFIKTGETSFEYVVKKMLPSAAGTKFGTTLAGGGLKPFGPFEWTPDSENLYPNADDLVIIVFLQNESTKEIYQSEIVRGIKDPPTITGLGEIAADEIIVYPNPADREFTIQLPGAIQKGVTIQVVNQIGQFVRTDSFSIGDQKKTINTESLAEGLYIIQLGEGKTAVRKKIVITHK